MPSQPEVGHQGSQRVFQHNEKCDPIAEFVMPLVVSFRGHHEICGTAVVLCGRLLITARHVIDYCFRLETGRPLPSASDIKSAGTDFGFSLEAIQMLGAGGVALWRVQQVTFGGIPTDLVLLEVVPANDAAIKHTWRMPRFKAAPPAIGSTVTAFGYYNARSAIAEDSGRVTFDYQPATTTGVVVEIHGEQRDRTRLNFPCFQFDGRLESGMSGGPIFDDTWRIVGFVCQTLRPMTPDEAHVSYGTLLWPFLGTEISVKRHDREVTSPYPLVELASARCIDVEGWEAIKILRDASGKLNGIAYPK